MTMALPTVSTSQVLLRFHWLWQLDLDQKQEFVMFL